jgi:iron complex transport system permease protein
VSGRRALAERVSPALQGALLVLALAATVVLSVGVGSTPQPPATCLRGVLATVGLHSPLEEPLQTIVALRLWRALTAAGVGAALALSGGVVQGLFRNGLASPSLIGVTGGASLGAAIATLLVGGYAPRLVLEDGAGPLSLLIPLFCFVGALAAVAFVAWIASAGGRISVTTLLLVGIAVNMCIAGAFAAIQSLSLENWEVSRALMAWTFGTLDDRSPVHAGMVWIGLALSAAVIPFVALELDLLRGGEDDARSLGVDTARLKLLCLVAAALSASAAVAVAGQIAFVGLVVPHLVRMLAGTGHRRLLVLCIPAGGLFLLGTDLVQRALFGAAALAPGVVMSLIGGPFFLFLLARHRREVGAW